MHKHEVRDLAPASFLSDRLAQATTSEPRTTTVQSTPTRQTVKTTSLILSGNSSPARTRGYNVRIGNNRSFRTFGTTRTGQLHAANGRLSKHRRRFFSSLPSVIVTWRKQRWSRLRLSCKRRSNAVRVLTALQGVVWRPGRCCACALSSIATCTAPFTFGISARLRSVARRTSVENSNSPLASRRMPTW